MLNKKKHKTVINFYFTFINALKKINNKMLTLRYNFICTLFH